MKRKFEDETKDYIDKQIKTEQISKTEQIKLDEICLIKIIMSYMTSLEYYKNISLVSRNFKKLIEEAFNNYIYEKEKYFPIMDYYIELTPTINYLKYLRPLKEFGNWDAHSKDVMDMSKEISKILVFVKDGNNISYYHKTTKADYHNLRCYSLHEKVILSKIFDMGNISLRRIEKDLLNMTLIDNLIHRYNAYIAGSYVLYNILNTEKWFPTDINLWIPEVHYGHVTKYLKENKIDYTVSEFPLEIYNRNCYIINYKGRMVQLIFICSSVINFIGKEFDINICKCFYDGKSVRAFFDIKYLDKREFEFIITSTNDVSRSVNRLEKYINRSFKCAKSY